MSRTYDDDEVSKGLINSNDDYFAKDEDTGKFQVLFRMDMWWRNPLLYILGFNILFSLVCIGINLSWVYRFGAIISFTSVLLSMILIFIKIVPGGKPYSSYGFRKVISGLVFTIFVVVFVSFSLYVQIYHISAHFKNGDPVFRTFPENCGYRSPDQFKNCVRIGYHIPNPTDNFGKNPLIFNSTLPTTSDVFHEIISNEFRCNFIYQMHESSEFYHARCIEGLTGAPYDLGFYSSCITSNDPNTHQKSFIWIHFQSRDSSWDHNYSDYMVRKLLTYATDDKFGYAQRLRADEPQCKLPPS